MSPFGPKWSGKVRSGCMSHYNLINIYHEMQWNSLRVTQFLTQVLRVTFKLFVTTLTLGSQQSLGAKQGECAKKDVKAQHGSNTLHSKVSEKEEPHNFQVHFHLGSWDSYKFLRSFRARFKGLNIVWIKWFWILEKGSMWAIMW
jgi:hypothetical protein